MVLTLDLKFLVVPSIEREYGTPIIESFSAGFSGQPFSLNNSLSWCQ